jgi:hypothetical protein
VCARGHLELGTAEFWPLTMYDEFRFTVWICVLLFLYVRGYCFSKGLLFLYVRDPGSRAVHSDKDYRVAGWPRTMQWLPLQLWSAPVWKVCVTSDMVHTITAGPPCSDIRQGYEQVASLQNLLSVDVRTYVLRMCVFVFVWSLPVPLGLYLCPIHVSVYVWELVIL